MPSAPPTHATAPRTARPLYLAELLSGLGDGVFWVGMVAAIADQPSFEWLLTATVIARLGPRALLSLPAGALVDRTNVRTLLVRCDLARATVMLTAAIALAAGLSPAWALLFVSASYVLGVPTRPGISAALPRVVAEDELAHTNAMICTIRQVMTFVGPLAGVGVALWSVPATFAVNGLSFAASAMAIASVRASRWGRATTVRSVSSGSQEGDVWAIAGLKTLAALTSVMYFVRGAEMVLHVLLVDDLLDAAPSSIGYIAGGVGIGAIAVTPLARRAAARDRAVTSITLSLGLTAAPTAALAVVGQVSTAAILAVPIGAGMVLFEVISVVTIQRTAPAAMAGRAFGAINMASNASKLAGAILAPIAAARFGTAGALVAVAVLVGATIVVAAAPLSRLSARADQRRRELQPVADVLSTLAIFEGASRVALERLADQLTEVTVDAGDVLIREGDPADDLYVARSGAFDVSIDGRVVNHVVGGEWFGEIGLVRGLPRTATVTATSDSLVWRLPGEVFLGVLGGLDDTAALDEGVARRLAVGRATVV